MFSDRLKALRTEKKITQEQLAKLIKVERSSVGKYESTNVIPSPDVLCKIADIFDVTLDYLFGRTENKQNEIKKITHEGDDITYSIKKGTPELTEEDIIAIKAIIEQNKKEKN